MGNTISEHKVTSGVIGAVCLTAGVFFWYAFTYEGSHIKTILKSNLNNPNQNRSKNQNKEAFKMKLINSKPKSIPKTLPLKMSKKY